MSNTIQVTKEGAVVTVALNRPEFHNAFNGQMVAELLGVFRELGSRNEVRAIVLTGEGRSFCAGADLGTVKEVSRHGYDLNLVDGQEIFALMLAVDECPKPVVGRINGSAIGGGAGLVSCCDIVVAVERAKFGFSEVRLGLVPAVISPFVLSKIGVSKSRELFLTGEWFDAMRAQQLGLVHHVVKEEYLDERVNERLEQLLKAAPGAQGDAKRLVRNVADQPKDSVRGFTTDLFARRWASEEGREGIAAFIEKRKPNWQG